MAEFSNSLRNKSIYCEKLCFKETIYKNKTSLSINDWI